MTWNVLFKVVVKKPVYWNSLSSWKWNPITFLNNIKDKKKKKKTKNNKLFKEKKKKKLANINMLFNQRNGPVKFVDDYCSTILVAKRKPIKGKELKMLSPKQMIQRLPIALA